MHDIQYIYSISGSCVVFSRIFFVHSLSLIVSLSTSLEQMVLTIFDSLETLRTCEENQVCYKNCFKFEAVDVNKCLVQIELPILLHTYPLYSELPSNIGTMPGLGWIIHNLLDRRLNFNVKSLFSYQIY